jgi:hypothetical protein
VEGKVYGFRVEDVEITKVAKKAGITKVAKMAKMAKRVQGIQMTTKHIIWPVTEKAEISIKTARHVIWRSLGSCSLTTCWSSQRKGDSSEAGSLIMYWSNSKIMDIYGWCLGKGNRRSE